jgi:hypothetical protein
MTENKTTEKKIKKRKKNQNLSYLGNVTGCSQGGYLRTNP